MSTAEPASQGAGLASTDAIAVEMTSLDGTKSDTSGGVEEWGTAGEQASEAGAEVEPAGPKSTATGAIINFVNSIIGAGIIGLPFALQEAGMIGGLLLILVVGVATDYSVRVVVNKAVSRGVLDYERVVRDTMGPRGFYTILFAMFVFAFGALVTYTIILADDVSIVAAHWAGEESVSPWLRRGVILSTSFLLLLPLGLVRNMASLARTSLVSLVAVAAVVVVVVVRGGTGSEGAPDPASPDGTLVMFAPRFFPALGAICFAFVCHHSSMVVFNSLQPAVATTQSWARITHAAIAIAIAACIVLAVTGYVTFRGTTQANLLNNYPLSDQLVNVTRIFFAITMVLTYPLELYVSRHCIVALWGVGGPGPLSWQKHVGITVALWAVAMGIALVVDDLGIVLELTGGTSATILGFVMPALLALFTTEYDLVPWRNEREILWDALVELVPAYALLVFGCVAFVASTVETVRSAVSPE